jgi:hypothetical protein
MRSVYYAITRVEMDALIQACYDRANADAYQLPEEQVLETVAEVNRAVAACLACPISEEVALFLGLPSKYDLEMRILKDAGD